MLDWLKSRVRREAATHPLQTDKGLQEVLAAIPWHAPAAALPDVADWLRSVDELRIAGDARQLARAVRRLDESSRASVRACWQDMWGTRGEDIKENAWLTLSAYHEAAAAAYRQALDACSQGRRATDDKPALALLALRAMTALMARKLLLRLRYRYADAGFWLSVHELLAASRTLALAHLRIKPYEGEEPQTLLAEYLGGAVLEVSPIENLSPAQIACAARLIAKHRDHIAMRDEPGATAPFYIDTAGSEGPLRNIPNPRPESGRYFGVGRIGAAMFALLREAESRSEVPEWLADTACDIEDYRALLKVLSDHWSGNPPRRRHARRKAEATLLGVNGFLQARRMVAASSFARSGRKLTYKTYLEMMAHHSSRFGHVAENAPRMPDEDEPVSKRAILQQLETAGDRELMEHWELLDISERGLGAAVSQPRKWLRVGVLIGFRTPESIDWRVGVVRRLGRTGQGKRLIGVEVLQGIPQSVQYLALDATASSNPWNSLPELTGMAWQDGILVSPVSRTLLVERGKYAEGRPIQIVLDGNFSWHRLVQRLEQGRDFDLVIYEDTEPPAGG